jgi:6-phosphogluconolactonase (cycloisomerase 2 family)
MQSFNKGFERPKKESAGAGALVISGQDIIDGVYQETISKNDAVYVENIKNLDSVLKLTNPATLPTSQGRGVAFSSDDTYMSVAHASSPFITIYKRSADTFTKLTNPATLPTGTGLDVAFSSDNTYMSVAHGTSPFVTIYRADNTGEFKIFKSNNDIAQLKEISTVGAGYAQQNGILNDIKKVVRIWRD